MLDHEEKQKRTQVIVVVESRENVARLAPRLLNFFKSFNNGYAYLYFIIYLDLILKKSWGMYIFYLIMYLLRNINKRK